MKRWRTSDIINILGDHRWRIRTTRQGGDVDTTGLVMTAKGAERDTHLFVCGFVTGGKVITTPDDCGIEMIEVKDGLDSSGGLNTSCPETALMYAMVCSKLRRTGYTVVPRLKDYF